MQISYYFHVMLRFFCILQKGMMLLKVSVELRSKTKIL